MADDGTDTTARRAPTRMPRWVKVFVIIGVAGALLLIALLLTQGGHG